MVEALPGMQDLVFAQTTRWHNGDLLLPPGSLVTRRDGHDTVCIDVKGNFDLRYTTWSRWNPIEDEGTKRAIVFSKLTLTL